KNQADVPIRSDVLTVCRKRRSVVAALVLQHLHNLSFTISRSLFFQRKLRPDPAESNAAVPSTVLRGERETLSSAQKKPRPTPRKILLDSSRHKYRAMSECRFHQQRGAMQTRFSSLRARPTAVCAGVPSAAKFS